jgi:hypothetical protein
LFPPQPADEALRHIHNIVRVNKAHLKVNLCELGLAVGTAKILIPETARKLNITCQSPKP